MIVSKPRGPAPFVKWSGSKRGVADSLLRLMPADIARGRYFEPFVGGGAVFTDAAPGLGSGSVLGDLYAPLAHLYVAVRDTPAVVADRYDELWRGLAATGLDHYYAVRAAFNAAPADDPAAFLFLTRTCFSGLIRFNRAGGVQLALPPRPPRTAAGFNANAPIPLGGWAFRG